MGWRGSSMGSPSTPLNETGWQGSGDGYLFNGLSHHKSRRRRCDSVKIKDLDDWLSFLDGTNVDFPQSLDKSLPR